MKFLALGDAHIDEHGATADWLDRQERVLEQAVEVATSERVNAILLAGDLFNKRRPSPAELLVAARFLDLLDGIPVVCIPGNHEVIAADAPCVLEVFQGGGFRGFHLYRTPGVHRLGDVSVACLPWTPISHLVAQVVGDVPRDEVYTVAAEHLVDVAAGLRASIDGPAVLMAHWSVSGSSLPSGLPVDQLREVVLPLADLEGQGWDAIVLGHIHASQLIASTPDEPYCPIFYVGSPAALNHGESDTAHGCWLLESSEIAGGVLSWQPDFRELDGPRFLTWHSNADEATDETCLARYAQASEDAIVRFKYEATEDEARSIDNNAIRQTLLDAGAASVTVQPSIVRSSRARAAGIDETLGEVESLSAWCVAEQLDKATADVLRDRLVTDLAETGR